MILGLDISSSVTGWTVIKNNGELFNIGAWDVRKYKNFFEKMKVYSEGLDDLTAFNIEHVFIEQSLQKFRPGFSSAKTISVLMKANGIVSYLAYEKFKIEPIYISANSARKSLDIKIMKGEDTKKRVLEETLKVDHPHVIEYTQHGNPAQKMYDMADSYVIAHAGLKWLKKS